MHSVSHYWTLPFSSFLYKTHLFNMENHLLCYIQSLPPNFQVEPKTGLFHHLLSFILLQTIIELCVGCVQVSNSTLSIYIPHKHWIGQCLWNLEVQAVYCMSCLSGDSDLTYSISFSQIGPEVETVSVCTDRMHISIPGWVGLFGAGKRGSLGASMGKKKTLT